LAALSLHMEQRSAAVVIVVVGSAVDMIAASAEWKEGQSAGRRLSLSGKVG
jgi:hypothetical protein